MLLTIGLAIEIVGAALVIFAAIVVWFANYREEEVVILKWFVYTGMFLTAFGGGLALLALGLG